MFSTKSFAIDVQILALLEGFMQVKALGLSNLVVEGDSTFATKRGSSICWVLDLANHVDDYVAKRVAKHLISFVGNFWRFASVFVTSFGSSACEALCIGVPLLILDGVIYCENDVLSFLVFLEKIWSVSD